VRSAREDKRRGGGVLRLVALAACICLLGAGAAGCSTTQEKAEAQKARSEHILKARAERQRAKKKAREKHQKHHGKQKGKAK
jgi:uncharacterized protein HemX